MALFGAPLASQNSAQDAFEAALDMRKALELDLQNRLYQLGFLLDDRDGDFGSKTQTAVKLFQQTAGLEATGIADNATLTLLYSDEAPRTEYAQITPSPAPTPEPATAE